MGVRARLPRQAAFVRETVQGGASLPQRTRCPVSGLEGPPSSDGAAPDRGAAFHLSQDLGQ
eukprot:4182229-Pyramimonas_sp.AAC.1